MASAAPSRKPYRKAPPQHRETRAGPTPGTPPAAQPDFSQVNRLAPNTPRRGRLPAPGGLQPRSGNSWLAAQTPPCSDSELDVSSLSSLELYIPPPPPFTNSSHRPGRTTAVGVTAAARRSSCSHRNSNSIESHLSSAPVRRRSPVQLRHGRTRRPKTAAPPRSILKQPAPLGAEHTYDTLRKSRSVELLDAGRRRAEHRGPPSLTSLTPPTAWNWKMNALEEKVRFSSFLDEITCRVLSPARLSQLGRSPGHRGSPAHQHGRHRPEWKAGSADRTGRWDQWVASQRRPDSQRELDKKGAGLREAAIGARGRGQDKKGAQRATPPQIHLGLLSHIQVGQRKDSSSSSCSSSTAEPERS